MEEYEIDLRKLIKALWNRRGLILFWTITLFLLGAFFILITSKKVYKSEGILVAYYGGQAPLTEEIFKNLFLTEDILKQIITNLDLKDDEGNPILPSALKGNFKIVSIDTVFKSNNEPELSTIILAVYSSEPELSKKMLDEWINVINQKIPKVFGQYLNEQRIRNVNERLKRAEKEFNKVSKEFTDFLKKSRTYALLTRLNVLRAKIDDYETTVYTLRVDINSKKNILKNLKRQLKEMEEGNRWIGLFFVEADKGDGELRQKIINVKNDLKKTEDLITAFKIKSRIEFREQNLKTLRQNLLKYNQELLDAQVKLAVVNDRRDNILKELKNKQLYIPVAKGISDETVWSQLISGNTTFDQIKGVKIISQSINPIYMSLQQKLTESNIDYYTTKLKIDHLQKQIEQLKEKITDETQALEHDKLQLAEYQKILSILNPIYDKFKKQYIDLQSRIIDLASAIWNLESQYKFYKKTLESAKKELSNLQAEYNEQKTRYDILATKYDTSKEIFISLQKRKQELESAAAGVSINILPTSYGNLPMYPEPRKRLMKGLVALVVAFLIGLFIALLNYYFSEEEV